MELRSLTAAQRAAYVESRGERCPFCGESLSLGGGPVDIEGAVARQLVLCHGCGECWDALYTLSGIEPGNYGDWVLSPEDPGMAPPLWGVGLRE